MPEITPLSSNPPKQLCEIPYAPGAMPFIGHTWSLLRRPFSFLESLRSLGDIVRVDIGRTPVYMLTRPELVHTILITEARRVERAGQFSDQMRKLLGNGIGTSEGELHLRHRRLMQPALHRNHIGTYVSLMHANTQALSNSWNDGETIDVHHASSDLITENMTGSMFGLSLSSDVERTVRRAVPTLADNFMAQIQTPKLLERFPLAANRRLNQSLRELREVINEIITQRLNCPNTGDDLLGMLLAAKDPDTGKPLSFEQVYDEIISILTAGIQTTATTLSWFFYELSQSPEVEACVLDEVHTSLDNNGPLREIISRLDYTRRAVHEILRLHPVLMLIRRVTQYLELGGVALPAGTDLGYSPYTIHRDPDIYPDPSRIDPDRWLPERTQSLPPGAFTAFGEGRHRCIGEFFAWMEILVAIVMLLPRWKLRLAPGQVVHEVNSIHPRPSSLRMIVNAR
jgi:cytochrome P450